MSDEILEIQALILEEIKGIAPCYAYQAAMRVHNYYHPECMVTSTMSVNTKTGEQTPVFKPRKATKVQ